MYSYISGHANFQSKQLKIEPWVWSKKLKCNTEKQERVVAAGKMKNRFNLVAITEKVGFEVRFERGEQGGIRYVLWKRVPCMRDSLGKFIVASGSRKCLDGSQCWRGRSRERWREMKGISGEDQAMGGSDGKDRVCAASGNELESSLGVWGPASHGLICCKQQRYSKSGVNLDQFRKESSVFLSGFFAGVCDISKARNKPFA